MHRIVIDYEVTDDSASSTFLFRQAGREETTSPLPFSRFNVHSQTTIAMVQHFTLPSGRNVNYLVSGAKDGFLFVFMQGTPSACPPLSGGMREKRRET